MHWGEGERKADLHPGLLMQVCNVELPAGRMGHQLVMLLQNLVESLQGQYANTMITNQTWRVHTWGGTSANARQ